MDSHFWDQAYQEDADAVLVADRILDAELANLSPGKALDLGCGSGANALKLARLGWQVLGLDWAETAVKLAEQAAKAEALPAEFLQADITTWQASDLFDLVISTYALPGGEASALALQQASRALAPDGTLIVAEWDRSMASGWNFDPADLPTPEELVALLPSLAIEKAEVVHIADMFGQVDDPRNQGNTHANIALVRARKP